MKTLKFSKQYQIKHQAFEDQGQFKVVTKRKYHKKTEKQKLKDKADKLMSLYIRNFWGYCMLKGLDDVRCSDQLNDMHIRTRGIVAIRYEELNHICGCSGHHVYYTNNPAKWEALVKKHFPKHWRFVEKHQNDKVKRTEELYKIVIARYENVDAKDPNGLNVDNNHEII